MEIKVLTYGDYQKLVANPEENALVIWHAEWAGPSNCYLRNLAKLPDIPDLTVYKIDIENPPISEDILSQIHVNRVPFSFLIKKGKPGIKRKYAGGMNIKELTTFTK